MKRFLFCWLALGLCLGSARADETVRQLQAQLKQAGFASVDIVLALTGTARNAAQITEVVAPQGRIGVIDGMDSLKAFDTAQMWSKCVSLHPELMFTRSTYGTPDMIERIARKSGRPLSVSLAQADQAPEAAA